MKKVLLVSDGIIHPPLLARWVLRQTLKQKAGYQIRRTISMDNLPPNLGRYAALVIYIHHQNISAEAVAVFDRYVAAGGGVLAVHSATASGKNSEQFTDILGGRFSGHGPVEPFEVTPTEPESPLFQGLPGFQVTDELYLHDLQPDIETHFFTRFEGRPVPMVWTRSHGEGRVCYACPGHTTATMRSPEYQAVLLRGLAWACGDVR